MIKFETKLSIALCAIVLMVAYGVMDSSLGKGAFFDFKPKKKIVAKNPIQNVPNPVLLNLDPPTCAVLNAAAPGGGISGDPRLAGFLPNWNTCRTGNMPFGPGLPTYCETISFTLQNIPNHRRRQELLSLQATCLRGGIDPYVLQDWDIQNDGGVLVPDNCVQLQQQSNQGILDPKKRDNLHMCWSGGLLQPNLEIKTCDLARWAIAADPARFVQLTDDIDTCANGGIAN